MWSFSDRGLYWVRTTTSWMSELTQLDSGKSVIRYLPPNGTAGLARSCYRMERRSPSPPARMIAMVRFTVRVRLHVTWFRGRMLARGVAAARAPGVGSDERAVRQTAPVTGRAGG